MSGKKSVPTPEPDAQSRATQKLKALLAFITEVQSKKKLSNRDLAKLMGVSHTRVNEIHKADHSLSLLNLQRLADALGLDLEVNLYYPRLSDDLPDEQARREEMREDAVAI